MTTKTLGQSVTVLAGDTWGESSDHRHRRHYLIRSKSTKINDRIGDMVFDGMDGIFIDEKVGTNVKGCWSDVSANPEVIKELIGPKGLKFLELLEKQRMSRRYVETPKKGRHLKRKLLFSELHVVSAWQFSVLVPLGGWSPDIDQVVLQSLRKHLGRILKKEKWVLT